MQSSQNENHSDYQPVLQITKVPISLKQLSSKSTSVFKRGACTDVLSKLTVAPMQDSVREVNVIPEFVKPSNNGRQGKALQSENPNNTIILPSRIGGSKQSQSYLSNNLSNNLSNILEQTDRINRDE